MTGDCQLCSTELKHNRNKHEYFENGVCYFYLCDKCQMLSGKMKVTEIVSIINTTFGLGRDYQVAIYDEEEKEFAQQVRRLITRVRIGVKQ